MVLGPLALAVQTTGVPTSCPDGTLGDRVTFVAAVGAANAAGPASAATSAATHQAERSFNCVLTPPKCTFASPTQATRGRREISYERVEAALRSSRWARWARRRLAFDHHQLAAASL